MLHPTWFQAVSVSAEVADVIAKPPPPGAPEEDVQKFIEDLAEAFSAASSSSSTVRLLGRSTVVSFGTRKPDVVGYATVAATHTTARASRTGKAAAASVAVFHIACLGDVKSRRMANSQGQFSDAEKGHVLSFLEDLLREQPWRAGSGGAGPGARVVAFLCDGVHIIFFQCTFLLERRGSALHVELTKVDESQPLPLAGAGGEYLAGLVSTPLSNLGYGVPSVAMQGERVALTACTGTGATSVGYAATWRGRTLFVKCYDPAARLRVREPEATALRALRGVAGVVQLFSSDGDGVLLLEPLGASAYSLAVALRTPLLSASAEAPRSSGLWRPVEQGAAAVAAPVLPPPLLLAPGAAEFCDLLDALAGMHTAGWVHRDPRPANFFRDATGSFFLGDLGSAVRVGESAHPDVPFGFTHGPLDALDALAACAALPPAVPAHDLEQVARLVYAAQARLVAEALPAPPEPATLAAFWRRADALEPLATLLRLAREAALGTPGGGLATTPSPTATASRRGCCASPRTGSRRRKHLSRT